MNKARRKIKISKKWWLTITRSLVTIFGGLFSIEWPLEPALRLGRSLYNKGMHVVINLIIQGGLEK